MQDKFGLTPLHLAAFNGHHNVVRCLLNPTDSEFCDSDEEDTNAFTSIIPADAKIVDYENRTPLHAACWRAHNSDYLSIVRSLLKANVDINGKDKHKRTALFWHLMNFDYSELVEYLLKNGAECTICDIQGRQPIHYAAYYARLNAVRLLIKYQAVLDCVDNDFCTPLHAGIKSSEVTKLLLACPINITAKDKLSRSPLAYAILKQSFKSCKKLLRALCSTGNTNSSNNKLSSVICKSIRASTTPNLDYLLKGETDTERCSIFHYCALADKDGQILQYIIDKKFFTSHAINEHLLTPHGKNVVHLAAFRDNLPFLEKLETLLSPDGFFRLINAKDKYSRKPLHIASCFGKIIRYLYF